MKNENALKSYNLPTLNVIKNVNDFIYSKAYVVLVAVLTVISNVLALDIFFFTFITVLAVYIAIFGKDLSPYLPMLCFCHIVSSVQNNPGINPNSLLFPKNSGYLLFYYGASIIIAMAVRFILDPSIGFKNIFKQKRKLSTGIFVLGFAYLISGIGSDNYKDFALKNIAFSLIQIVAIFVPYFVLSFTVKWNEVKKDYLCFSGLMLGLTAGAELIFIYALTGVMNGIVPQEDLVFTGWGISNNIGSYISTMIPFACYYVYTSKRPIAPLIVMDFLMVATIFSLSRTAIIIGSIILITLNVIIFIKSSFKTRLHIVINAILLLVIVYVFALAFFKILNTSFTDGLHSLERKQLYSLAIKTFLDYPIFGRTFYSLNVQIDLTNTNWVWAEELSFSSFFPGRWHNTILQLLATGGIIALLGYAFHRYQTFKLFLNKRSVETVATALFVIVLLVESLLDCHFFNVGPILFYSCALAFVEFAPTPPNNLLK